MTLGDRVLELRAQLGRGIVVGISGVDCAGKSTLAASVPGALVIPGDEFTRPVAEREDYYESFDYAQVFDVVVPAVRAGYAGELALRVTDWENDGWREQTIVLEPDAIVIVEGCFLFRGREGELDLRVWLDLPIDRVVERALRRPRDLERMGGPDGVRARYASRYLPAQERHLAEDDPRGRADLVLSTA